MTKQKADSFSLLFCRDFCQHFVQILLGRVFPETEAVIFAIAGDDVEVQMIDTLTGCGAAVRDDVDSSRTGVLHDLTCQHVHDMHDLFDGFFVCFDEVADMFLRHDNRMAVGQLGDIQDSQNILIFIDYLGWNFVIDDIAEYAHR